MRIEEQARPVLNPLISKEELANHSAQWLKGELRRDPDLRARFDEQFEADIVGVGYESLPDLQPTDFPLLSRNDVPHFAVQLAIPESRLSNAFVSHYFKPTKLNVLAQDLADRLSVDYPGCRVRVVFPSGAEFKTYVATHDHTPSGATTGSMTDTELQTGHALLSHALSSRRLQSQHDEEGSMRDILCGAPAFVGGTFTFAAKAEFLERIANSEASVDMLMSSEGLFTTGAGALAAWGGRNLYQATFRAKQAAAQVAKLIMPINRFEAELSRRGLNQ